MSVGLRSLVVALLAAASPALAQGGGREGPAEMRRILAEAVCLAEAYPGTPVAADSAGVIAVYLGALDGRVTAADIAAVRDLARAAQPAAPAAAGGRNLAIARCILFAGDPRVRQVLGEKRRAR